MEQLGSTVTGFNIGDHVYGIGDVTRTGCNAELVAVDYRTVAKIPDSADLSHAAGVPVTALTAYQSLFRIAGALPPGVKTVLVLGAAGGVGSMAIQLLKAKTQVKVIATASRPESQIWVKELGADIVIDHSGDVLKQLKDQGIEQVDFVFAVKGLESSLSWLPQLIKPYVVTLPLSKVVKAENFGSL